MRSKDVNVQRESVQTRWIRELMPRRMIGIGQCRALVR